MHCAETYISRNNDTWEVGGVTHRVTCTWWLPGLAVKALWLGLGGPIFALAAWTGLENATFTL